MEGIGDLDGKIGDFISSTDPYWACSPAFTIVCSVIVHADQFVNRAVSHTRGGS